MPRIRKQHEERPPTAHPDLVQRLIHELRGSQVSGQPLIMEQSFPNGRLRVLVIWDAWERLPLEDRTEIILQAYQTAEGSAYRERIALASGLTVPEAYAAGMPPYQVIPAIRPGDAVTEEQCNQALLDEGASTLLDPTTTRLRFGTVEEAEAARTRLVRRLPGSDPVWIIHRDVLVQDHAGLQEDTAILN